MTSKRARQRLKSPRRFFFLLGVSAVYSVACGGKAVLDAGPVPDPTQAATGSTSSNAGSTSSTGSNAGSTNSNAGSTNSSAGTTSTGVAGAVGRAGSNGTSNDSAAADRGATIYTAQSCDSCHRANGAGDQGPNITFSMTAGIGAWTYQQFHDALRLGKNIDGSDLCVFSSLYLESDISETGMQDLYAFLKSKPKIDVVNKGSYCP